MHPHGAVKFDQTPFILIWEATQACAQVCRHCRAEAINQRHPDELTLEEGQNLIDQVAGMGARIFIFTGGDPLQREDLDELIQYAKDRNLRVGAIPAATELLTAERVQRLKAAGLDQMALSLDNATAEKHDSFRGVEGSFGRTMNGARFARDAGLRLQINTSIAAWNVADFEAMCELVEGLGIVFWEVFFVVPVGRGAEMSGLRPEQYENIFAKLYAVQRRAPFVVKITEAPHYRPFVAMRESILAQKAEGRDGSHMRPVSAGNFARDGRLGPGPQGVNAGKGFMFISHTGEAYPSGFLPLSAGNVRRSSVADIYRNSPLFNDLRDASLLKGHCGACEYGEVCGGSRSRAYALSGDYLAADTSCWYKSKC